MTFAEVLRLVYIVFWSLGIVGSIAQFIQFRGRLKAVEKKAGPVPTPMAIFQVVILLILLARIGEISTENSTVEVIVRVLGIGFSLYGFGMVGWGGRSLGRYAAPGPAVFQDHELITSGPYRLARHPGYGAIQAISLGTALGTLNWLLLLLWPLIVVSTYLTSRAEEGLLRDKFGAAYEEYAMRTKRFYPGIW